LISNLLAQNLTLDILINNAAFVGTSDLADINSKFEGQSLSSFRRILEVNLNSVFHLCQGLLPLLNKSQSGSIINISSIYGSFGPDWNLYSGTGMSNSAAYSSSKGAVNQLTRWLATTLSPKIRVNSISPGGIARNQPRDFIEKYEKRTPLGRMAVEEDFKGVISFLASDNSSYVTGQNIYVDGGWSAW
jgi:NAD(P)-dependent dehydrogenase (short-subunit alcohol dehydrogenase family)